MKTQFRLNQLADTLNGLQDITIGLFKPHYPNCPIELVIEANKDTIRTICLGELGGYSDNHYPNDDTGKLILFPEGQTLLTIKDNPFELDKIVKQFDR